MIQSARFLITTIAVLLLSAPAQAAGYGIGTAGYLYEDCKRALAESKNLKDAHDSYCGAFIEGYVMGLMVTNTAQLPEPDKADPCYADKAAAFDHINGRFCKNLPRFKTENGGAGEAITTMADLLAKWVSYNRHKLDEPLPGALDGLLGPGKFCNDIEDIHAPTLPVSKALQNLSWPQILGAKSLVSMKGKHEQCLADIARAKGSAQAFRATQCGAEIMGFITGMQSTAQLKDTRPAIQNPQCAKPIKRLYDSFDMAQTMCVNTQTQPLLIAKIFTANYRLIAGEPGFWAQVGLFDAGALGAVGYETIYRGFACRNAAEIKNRKKKN